MISRHVWVLVMSPLSSTIIQSSSIRLAIYYRERTNFWWEKVAAMPEVDPQRALCREVAKSYEKLAASYEQRT